MFGGFSVLKQRLGSYLTFRFLSVLPCYPMERLIPQFTRFPFLLNIIRSGRLAEIIIIIMSSSSSSITISWICNLNYL